MFNALPKSCKQNTEIEQLIETVYVGIEENKYILLFK